MTNVIMTNANLGYLLILIESLQKIPLTINEIINDYITEITHTLLIQMTSDYRSGIHIHCIEDKNYDPDDESDDGDLTEYNEYKFVLPINYEYCVYVVNEFPNYTVIYEKDCDTEEEFIKIKNKIFSQVHGSMPFVVTGMTCAYKDEGYFPDVPDDIKMLPEIEELNHLENDGYYFIIILDQDGNQICVEPLIPIF